MLNPFLFLKIITKYLHKKFKLGVYALIKNVLTSVDLKGNPFLKKLKCIFYSSL